ncbi:hypothetical protein T12_8739 [Trichinella patagoniensis]|uniref:Uncharacterized protein n=1 Tax=Trichinella patagoniensis TaxID=990121 RepID=A0A0V1A3G6_9BILA|nr:hypothetical protein T12_8739 [Trichinella patagoniensis]
MEHLLRIDCSNDGLPLGKVSVDHDAAPLRTRPSDRTNDNWASDFWADEVALTFENFGILNDWWTVEINQISVAGRAAFFPLFPKPAARP